MAEEKPRDRRRKPKKVGRRKEEGGHRRIDVSVNKLTDEILQIPENRSKYVEYCVNTATFSRRIRFQESKVTANDEGSMFKTAAVFEWIPLNSKGNAIILIACYFRYRCEGEGFRFRMSINGAVTSPIKVLGSNTWTSSHVYTNSSFHGEIKTFPNQSSYTIEFQFAPQGSSCTAYVKDINVLLEVVEGMPAVSP